MADRLGRPYGRSETFEWTIPTIPADAPEGAEPPPILYDQSFPQSYESWRAAGTAIGGRFPAGQSRLFQGLWTDPVTGHGYARARWLDSRNASWLSEDPLGAVDSTNLYAFVGWQPNMGMDPKGLCVGDVPCPGWAREAIDRGRFNLYVQWETAKGVASDTGRMVVGAADFITLGQSAKARASVGTFFKTEGTLVERGNAANEAGNRAQLAVVTLGFSEAEDKSQHLENLVGIQAVQDSGTLLGTAWVEGDPEILLEGLGKLVEGSGQIAGTVLLVYAPVEAGVNRLRAGSAPSSATRLYRVIGETELEDLLRYGDYGLSPHGGGKYFAFTREGAERFANSSINAGRRMTTTAIEVPESTLGAGTRFIDPGAQGAGTSIHFSDEALVQLYETSQMPDILSAPWVSRLPRTP